MKVQQTRDGGVAPVADLLPGMDWSASPLGPPESWPPSLRTVFNLILNSKFPMFVAWGPELGFLYNDAYAEILGSKHPAALGSRFHDIWSEIWPDIEPLIESAMAGVATYREDLPLLMRRKGFDEQTWFTFSYAPVVDESGRVGGMYCACNETTSVVLAQRVLREESQRLHGLFRQAPGFMAVTDGPEHRYELANDAYMQLVGHRELIGRNVRQALPELAGQGFFELLDQVYESGLPYIGHRVSVGLQRIAGEPLEHRYLDFIFQPITGADGRPSGIFIQGHDVSEQVKAEAAMSESEAKFRTITDAMPQMAWSTRPDGFHDYFNRQWYDYTGVPVGSTDGERWSLVFHPDDQDRAWELWRHSLATGDEYEIEYRLKHHSGQYRWVLGRALPIRDERGGIIRWMGTCTDIHEQKLATEELKLANQRKDEFLAMLAHELRNPLAPINSAAQLIMISGDDRERIKHANEIILRQVRHMTDLVNDLLDVSRVTRGLVTLDKQAVDIKSVINNSIEQVLPLIESRQHVLNTRLCSGNAAVLGDRTRLMQVLVNLLTNAARYTPEGGTIEVGLEVGESEVAITVTDNGGGIEPALLPHIFDLFTQGARTPDRSQGGLGLGLALVKSLLLLHGGRVEAESDGAGMGSTFRIHLPTIGQDQVEEQGLLDLDTGAQPSSPLRVMVVDDNVDAARSLAALLEADEHDVLVKADARAALADSAVDGVQVFILDIGLPDIDGYELARRLRSRPETARACFIALTGYGQARDKVLAEAAGFDHHFVKPVDIEHLTAVLRRVG